MHHTTSKHTHKDEHEYSHANISVSEVGPPHEQTGAPLGMQQSRSQPIHAGSIDEEQETVAERAGGPVRPLTHLKEVGGVALTGLEEQGEEGR